MTAWNTSGKWIVSKGEGGRRRPASPTSYPTNRTSEKPYHERIDIRY